MKNHQESTYALIVRSEEKSRTVLEVMLFAIFSLSVIVSIWQFAHQPVQIPAIEHHAGADVVWNAPAQSDNV